MYNKLFVRCSSSGVLSSFQIPSFIAIPSPSASGAAVLESFLFSGSLVSIAIPQPLSLFCLCLRLSRHDVHSPCGSVGEVSAACTALSFEET